MSGAGNKGSERLSGLMRTHPPKVMRCDCASIGTIIVKSGVAPKHGSPPNLAPRITPDKVPFNTRDAGAKIQDAKYGAGMRLHNPRFAGKPKEHVGYTCTICGRQKAL